ncbi:MAG: hypothetical protein JJU00_16930 [Opitutales bacterium]|nr:hypothetical protein [Opitutales bacterium]
MNIPIPTPRNHGLKRLLGTFGAVCALVAAPLAAQPTYNPVEAHYGLDEGFPAWTSTVQWGNVIDMSAYTNGDNHFERFENARDELHAQGGGVLYYPAGVYEFDLPDMGYGPGIGPMSRGLMLKSGVVIRGETPTANQAVVRTQAFPDFARGVETNLEPETVFVFPTHMRGTDPVTGEPNTAGEVPSHWSFIGMTVGDGEDTLADVNNIGVVNVRLDGGTIYWGYHTNRPERMDQGNWFRDPWKNTPVFAPEGETWASHEPDGTHYMHGIHGADGWHQPVWAGSGRLVMGVRIENGAPWNDMYHADRNSPSSTVLPDDHFGDYRFAGRISVHGSDIFVANNSLPRPTKNFVHRAMTSNEGEQVVLFDYSAHIGVDINKSNYGGKQEAETVQTPGSGYYFRNIVVRDNYIFNRGNKNFEVSGKWVSLINNHADKWYWGNYFPTSHIANPEAYPGSDPDGFISAGGRIFDGHRWQVAVTASDYMNRGYDIGGRNVWVHECTVVNTGSLGNDGEGIMAQRHNNVETFSWAYTYSTHDTDNSLDEALGAFPGGPVVTRAESSKWSGIYDMHASGFLAFKTGVRTQGNGTMGILKPENNWILDVTITPNLLRGPGEGVSAPSTGHAAGSDYLLGDHTDPVSAPANVHASVLPNGYGIDVTWEDTADNEMGFRIDRRVDGGAWNAVAYRPRQGLGKDSGVNLGSPYVDASYPHVNPERWVDYTAPLGSADLIEYRVVAINYNDDDSTGVSDTVAIGEAPSPTLPAENPVHSVYSLDEGFPAWTGDVQWDNVIDMSNYSNGDNHFERFENARDELYAEGGGVLYYPAGEYFFDLPDMGYGPGMGPTSRGLMLKSGVVIRGETPTANQAVVRPTEDTTHPDFANDVSHNLDPGTVFVFPTHMRGTDPVTDEPNSAGELPSHWSFIGITVGENEETLADVHNVGVVNVTLEGGTIYWGYHTNRAATMQEGRWFSNVWKNNWPAFAPEEETWAGHTPDGTHYMHSIHGAENWHDPVYAGSGRLVMGVKINNGATWNDMFYPDRRNPDQTFLEADSFSHYRFTGRISIHGSDVFVANNVIAKPTKNFIHRMLQNPRAIDGNAERLVLFDYANHIGVDINKSNYGGKEENPTVITPGSGYYFDNIVVRDNWVFNRGNKNFEISGQWVTITNNHAEKFQIGRTFPYDYVTNPDAVAGSSPASGVTMEGVSFDGWDYQHTTSASDYMNRGYDLGGRNLWAGLNTLVNSGSIGNDGEGVMSQEHNRVGAYSWAFTDSMHGRADKGPGTFGEQGWHGTWNMQQFGLLLLRNWSHGSVGVFGAARESSPQTGLNWVLDVSIVGGNPGPGGIISTFGDGPGPNEPVDYSTTDHFDSVSAPTDVTAVLQTDGGVRIDWVDTADNELGFRVERSVDGGDWRTIAYRPMSNLLKTVTDVQDPLERKDGSSLVAEPTMISQLNPQAWVDYLAPVGEAQTIEYRVVAINSNDDDSTGVSAVAALEEAPPVPVSPVPVVHGPFFDGPDAAVSFATQSGYSYTLEYSTDLEEWNPVPGATVSGDGNTYSLAHPGGLPAAGSGVFYRLAVEEE